MTRNIWIYKIPNIDHLIAKPVPWACQIPVGDGIGGTQYSIMQGVMIEEPAWESVTKYGDRTYAMYKLYIYDVTELGILNFNSTK